MKTMLDPRIVAARVQRRWILLQGPVAFFEVITPSSQGHRAMFIYWDSNEKENARQVKGLAEHSVN